MPRHSEKTKILLVEDSDDDAFFFDLALRKTQWASERIHVIDGRQAVDYLETSAKEEKCPDIIFLDLHMPKMTGLELLKILKADADLSHIPVVICTDSKLVKEMDECKRLGAAEVISKPASFLLIKYEIRNAIKAIKATRESQRVRA